jgi:hypothetical protein
MFVPDLVTININNAGKAQFAGVEVEMTLRPVHGLALESIDVGAGILELSANYTGRSSQWSNINLVIFTITQFGDPRSFGADPHLRF